MRQTTRELADFLSRLTFADIPPGVVAQAKKCLLDFLGVLLSGARTPEAKRFFAFIEPLGGRPEASVIPFGHRTTCAQAAMVNGFTAHGLELDDGHIVGHVHPGVTGLPAALAVAEKTGASGKDFLASVVAAYETVIRVGDAITPSAIYDRGIHAPGLTGAFGAAAAAGKLMRLDPGKMTHAMGNCCLTPVSPFQTFTEGAGVKDLYAGWPALVGTLAAQMAHADITGPVKLFEGSMGFCRNVADGFDLEKITRGLGEDWRILEVYFKKHASCSFSHTTVDAALEIASAHGPDPEQIERIVVSTHRFASDLGEKSPQTASAKKSSIPFCVALALLKQRVFLDEFDLDPGEDQRVLALAQRVEVRRDPELDRIHLADEGCRPARVEVFTRNHGILSAHRQVAKGWPEDPLSAPELQEKFNRLVAGAVSPSKRQRIVHAVESLERAADLSELIRELV